MTPVLEKIKKLTSLHNKIKNFHEEFKEKYSGSSYDKKGYGFKTGNVIGNLCAFSTNVSFESYAGTYGNSSVHSALYLDNSSDVTFAFVKALNKHQELIFQTMAEFLEDDINGLKDRAQTEINEISAALEAVSK